MHPAGAAGADERLTTIDAEAFARDVAALRTEVEAEIGAQDLRHLRKLERWGRRCAALGYATAWLAPNPLSALLISLGSTARWTIVAHHVSHGGLDRVPGVPARYTSRGFAKGARRAVDWLDWILPEAWHEEHDLLHHHRTGEDEDPDLVEVNARAIREADVPLPLKYAMVAFYACTWKLTYYAPSTFQVLVASRRRRAAAGFGAEGAVRRPGAPNVNPSATGRDPEQSYASAFDPRRPEGREYWLRCVLPYAAARFGVIPALFLPLGPAAAANVLANSLAAEVMTNLHTFLLIVPNHAGGDLFRFEGRARTRAERCLRQVVGSTNYQGGSDVLDFLQGYLNYQIEHHLFPDLPPLKYREIQPRVRALCAAHGVPYVQEGVFRRAAKLLDVLVGRATMPRVSTRAAGVWGEGRRQATRSPIVT